MIRIFVRKLKCLFFVGCVFVSATLFSNEFSTQFQDKLLDAQESFENVYYELVKKGHFDYFYNNNLIINTDFDYEFPRNGAILLALTEWLEQSQHSESQFLLKKLNKFFGLQFHRFICKIDVPKAEQGVVSHAYHRLYNHKVPAAQSIIERHPFRTTLTKAMIFFLMVEFDQSNYQQKKESIVYFLEGVRKKLIKINNGLSAELKVPERFLEDFINHVEIYGLREPLITPVNVKLVIFFVVLGLAVTALVVYLTFYVIPQKDDLWAGFIFRLSKFGEAMGKSLAIGGSQGIAELNNQGQITAQLSSQAATIVQPVIDQINQLRVDLIQNVNQIPINLLNPQQLQNVVNNLPQPVNNQQENTQVPARELGQQLAAGAGEGLINGLGRGILNAPRNMFNAVVLNPIHGAYNYMRGPNTVPQQPPVQQPVQQLHIQQPLVQQVVQQPNSENVVVPHDQPVNNSGDGN